jgi:hypothetical protein
MPIFAAMLLAVLPAMAQSPIATGDFLQLHTWQEKSPLTGAWVEGYRLLPRAGGDPFDYYESGGHALDGDALASLGILAKRWDTPAEAPAETAQIALTRNAPFVRLSAVLIADTQVFAEVCSVPEPDRKALRAEDAAAMGPKPARTGVFQPLMPPLTIGGDQSAWQLRDDGGWSMAVLIDAGSAHGLRIEFERATLPAGAQLFVYNADDPAEAYGPLEIQSASGPYWSPTCFAARVVVACVLPPDTQVTEVDLYAARVAYLYRDIGALAKSAKDAGACNLDAACHPAWSNTAAGVGGIGTIGSAGSLFCTGALITDLDPCTQTPFFLTANHCITRDADAEAGEFYWFYDSNACDGAAPDPATVPRTIGGADRLAFSGGRPTNGAGNDFCLLRLRNLPPTNVTHLGWSTMAPPTGEAMTCVHHPRGDFKRITFGELTNANPLAPHLYHEVTWLEGTTEPGSSGSPMLRTDTQQIIGQLWGGGASCINPFDPDYYGRFDVTYPVIASYLAQPLVAAFSAAEYTAHENDGEVMISVTLNKPAPAGYTVNFAATPGTASASDFIVTNGTLAFMEGEDTATFGVTIIDDTHTEDDETVRLVLSAPSCGELDAVLHEATLLIIDDDLDSDGDGISDADELSGFFGFVTDPFNPDTDGDGLSDGEEAFGVYGFVTDPTLRDSDGDGLSDFDEILLGLDPTDMTDASTLPTLDIPWFRAYS